MLPTLTIYLAGPSTYMMRYILNGVVMIVSQTSMIWGFAFLVSMWQITRSVTARSAGADGASLEHGWKNSMLPMLIALTLTSAQLKTTVQVQSLVNGSVTSVSNVPVVVVAIPALGSVLSKELGDLVGTAFQAAGTNYSKISASGNGFINPLKILLSSRSALMRLGSIDSQVRTLVSSCITSDSDISLNDAVAQIMNAGNTGASDAKSLVIAGDVSKTAIGALLFVAAQNNTGFVPELVSDPNTILSCADAADYVSQNITDAFNSPEFARVIQGSINGADDFDPSADYSYSNFQENYSAIRTASSTFSALIGGSAQAKSEAINFLFSELVSANLNCLKAEGNNKSTCLALATQSLEQERSNLQAASAVNPMLNAMGAYANHMLGLIIAIGPIVIMFMMFAGINAGHNIKAMAHVIAWPMIMMSLGAEVVNGMIYMQVSNFLQTLSHGGYISQAASLEAYKQVSLQVGTASHIMASLPVIMGAIFALKESASVASSSSALTTRSDGVAEQAVARISSNTPLMSESSMFKGHFAPGVSTGSFTGATELVSSSAQFGQLTQAAQTSSQQAVSRQQSITEGQQNLNAWQESFRTGDYSKVGVDMSTGESVRKTYEQRRAVDQSLDSHSSISAEQANRNASDKSFSGGLSIGVGGIGGNLGGSLTTITSATDTLSASQGQSERDLLSDSKALQSAVSEERHRNESSSSGKESTHALDKALAAQTTVQKAITETQSESEEWRTSQGVTTSFLGATAKIGADELALHSQANSNFQRFQLLEGRRFALNPATNQALSSASQALDSPVNEQFFGDPRAKAAATRHVAAVMLAQDPSASPENRKMATDYLLGEAKAMTAYQFQKSNSQQAPLFNIRQPEDPTSVRGASQDIFSGNGQDLKNSKSLNVVRPTSQPQFSHARSTLSFADVATLKKNVMTATEGPQMSNIDQIAREAGLGSGGNGTNERSTRNALYNAQPVTNTNIKPDLKKNTKD